VKLFSQGGSLLHNMMRKDRVDRDLTEEVGSYVELLTEKKMKQGMNERDARRAALVEMGGLDQSTRIDECEIEVSDYFTESGAYGEAVVTTLAGEELRKLYQAHGDQLFDRNVRLFLGARKGSVNAGIRDTLSSTTERKNF
jgi:hypothetical protein